MSNLYSDDFEIDECNNITIKSDSSIITSPIYEHDVAVIMDTLLSNIGAEVEADSLARLDGLDETGVLNLALACSKVLQQLQGVSREALDSEEDQGYTLEYEDRWNPNRSVRWTVNAGEFDLIFERGSWQIEYEGSSAPYSESHFGYLGSDHFPLTGKDKE